jgi:hypothetical protein
MMKTGTTSKKLLMALLLIVIVIPVFTMGGCPYNNDFSNESLLKDYNKNYAKWSWQERYQHAVLIEPAAMLEQVEFSWLDLPVDKIEVTDAASGSTGACSDH